MIDFGLTKILVIGVVALVVIGPEKLPKVARMAGSLYGRAQRYINEVKSEVSREMELDELRKLRQDAQQAVASVEQSIAGSLSDAAGELHDAWTDDHGGGGSGGTATPDAAQMARKIKDFRKNKLAREVVPGWYKHRNGRKTRVISAAARVAKFRSGGFADKSAFF